MGAGFAISGVAAVLLGALLVFMAVDGLAPRMARIEVESFVASAIPAARFAALHDCGSEFSNSPTSAPNYIGAPFWKRDIEAANGVAFRAERLGAIDRGVDFSKWDHRPVSAPYSREAVSVAASDAETAADAVLFHSFMPAAFDAIAEWPDSIQSVEVVRSEKGVVGLCLRGSASVSGSSAFSAAALRFGGVVLAEDCGGSAAPGQSWLHVPVPMKGSVQQIGAGSTRAFSDTCGARGFGGVPGPNAVTWWR